MRDLDPRTKVHWWHRATELWLRYEAGQEVLRRAGLAGSRAPEPGTVPSGTGPGRPGARADRTHDEVWADPPWVREGRRPSMDELIPGTAAEVARWTGAVRYWGARELADRTYAGLRPRLDLTDMPP